MNSHLLLFKTTFMSSKNDSHYCNDGNYFIFFLVFFLYFKIVIVLKTDFMSVKQIHFSLLFNGEDMFCKMLH